MLAARCCQATWAPSLELVALLRKWVARCITVVRIEELWVARLWVLTLSPTQNLKDRNTHGYIEGPREPTLAYQLRKGGGQSRVVPCRFETEDRRSVGENRVSDYSCPVLLHGSATAVAAPARAATVSMLMESVTSCP